MGIYDQFRKPTGFMGHLVGYALAFKNRERSEWVLALLDLKPTERVLEIGFGPGADIQRASRHAAFVAGIDHSEVMVHQASSRNSRAIAEGRVELKLGTAGELPYPEANFDCIFAINVAQFWKDLPKTFAELRRVLKPGGRILLAVQPRNKGASDETARQVGSGLAKTLAAAGFDDIHCEFKAMRPISTAAVQGRRPIS
jgi:ubiquinone/menaquinone biosynthesis C-methylase UbiE